MTGKFTLEGIVTALVTPFTHAGEVDEDALREIVRFQLKHRVHGFFVCGTTGLGPAMSPDQRRRVAEVVVQETGRKIPVVVQVGASDPQASFQLAEHAEKAGADAIASLTPFYYQPGEDAIIEYFTKLAGTTKLPLFVYNIPRHTGNNVDANLLLKLSRIPNVVGMKDSSRDFVQLVDCLSIVPAGFGVINGTDSYLFAALCAGTHAGVSATSNLAPELFVEMYDTFRRKEYDKAASLQLKIHALRKVTSMPPIAPLLEGLRLRGLKSGLVKPPLRSMNRDELVELRASLSRILPELRIE
ncbi:dihydrodipicolinate synthase family protein [Candidatus Bathyarchaeota archaeon]|nr:dihydrodipicolinate synthase family protein [Candidatus Bathyarchaeota archaeon]